MVALTAFVFDRLAERASSFTGHPATFFVFAGVVVAWLALGPLVAYSNAWQLVINTGTTIVTTGLVLLLQHSQNDDTNEIKTAIRELVHAHPDADDAKAPT
jgi:low affinity Fe/Cu permease